MRERGQEPKKIPEFKLRKRFNRKAALASLRKSRPQIDQIEEDFRELKRFDPKIRDRVLARRQTE
jgi:hypothetical protein